MLSTKRDELDHGVDPFKVSLTIASFANHIFRRNHMASQSIAIIPDNGYNPNQITSQKCRLWLQYLSRKHNINIKHTNNGGEVQCGPYRLDGVCEELKTIFEFQGCYWHGCLKCYSPNTFNTIKQMHQQSVHLRHYHRVNFIKKQMNNYKFVELWEHE